jgi:hypothetical protein
MVQQGFPDDAIKFARGAHLTIIFYDRGGFVIMNQMVGIQFT